MLRSLDTNVCSYGLRSHPPEATERVAEVQRDQLWDLRHHELEAALWSPKARLSPVYGRRGELAGFTDPETLARGGLPSRRSHADCPGSGGQAGGAPEPDDRCLCRSGRQLW